MTVCYWCHGTRNEVREVVNQAGLPTGQTEVVGPCKYCKRGLADEYDEELRYLEGERMGMKSY